MQTKQILKLRLLALVLALALVWYSLNPVPTPFIRLKRDDELPDEKKREVETYSMPATLPLVFTPLGKTEEHLLSADDDEDDFEWPEFISG
ncbi:MAG TPA: hypothetical protein VM095_05380 [Pyrinomonadaceae bacterium]|nr:hypothetical protein [Pyrinomonadaceae bacterium]